MALFLCSLHNSTFNSVWGRLQFGVYSFCYGWGLNPKTLKTTLVRQFFMPFTTDKKFNEGYLQKVRKDVQKS